MRAETVQIQLYNDATQPFLARARDLTSRLTLAEKVSQMMFAAPAIERLGIPQYHWWNEGLHGLGRAGIATVFPQAIGLAATWNPDLVHRVACVTSDEARAKHHRALRQGMRQIYAGLTFWSPNINIFRDPRWGRGQETYGEDPYLAARMGVAFVTGLQGDDPHYLKLAATPKHFAVHSGPESSRHSFDVRVEEREYRDFYLFAFEACVVEGKAASIMGAYNRLNGEACCASPTLLEKILRGEWGFEGYVVSDCGAIYDIFAHHKLTYSRAEAAAVAVRSGCDLECGNVYGALPEAVELGLITEAEIDRAVSRLFNVRFRLGMFDGQEQIPESRRPGKIADSGQHRELALQTARESIVLLKNENGLLPLRKDLHSIAVIGPNAHDAVVMLGNYHGTPLDSATPLQGIQHKVSSATRVYHARGCPITSGMPPLEIVPTTCLRHGENTDQIGLTGAYYLGSKFEGEPVIQRFDPQIDFVWRDTGPITGRWGEGFSVRWSGYLVPPVSGQYKLGVHGYSGYRLRLDHELLIESDFIHSPLRKIAEVALEAGRPYPICLESWNEGLDPQTQLLWALPGIDYEAEAVELASKSEIVIMVMGLSAFLEGEEMPAYQKVAGFEGGDRTDIQLPQSQENLLRKIHTLGKPIVLVLLNGSALAINWAKAHVSAIVEAWYPGQAGGEALADVLFGDYNPGGKLPVTFYKSVEDLPPFDDYQLEGHTYRYFRGEALFPFGYGISFTTFKLNHPRLDRRLLRMGDHCALHVEVTNTGAQAGDEVVQLYASDLEASVTRPIQQLIGFRRVHLASGETQTLTFRVHTSQFGFHNQNSEFVLEPGAINLMVGTSSADLQLAGQIEIDIIGSARIDKKVFFSDVTVSEKPQ